MGIAGENDEGIIVFGMRMEGDFLNPVLEIIYRFTDGNNSRSALICRIEDFGGMFSALIRDVRPSRGKDTTAISWSPTSAK